MTSRATVHVGPNGGTEYRLWTGPDTYRTVGKYKALPHMSEDERKKAADMEAARSSKAHARAAAEQSWREFRRGG